MFEEKKFYTLLLTYRGIHEKGSGDVVSAVCNTIYAVNLSLCTQTPSEHFSWIPLYQTKTDQRQKRVNQIVIQW